MTPTTELLLVIMVAPLYLAIFFLLINQRRLNNNYHLREWMKLQESINAHLATLIELNYQKIKKND